ncbi:hypothetical protein CDAR_474941 [Caerostris darwini]|uniref:Uncharacterized protein n=1 Tax=Caerostris darwini TaxID=1538125 RepID=A0AAV4QQ68_9ARAC|nr:hypothetical protein CDAR_474941 [Caerostris darwini]
MFQVTDITENSSNYEVPKDKQSSFSFEDRALLLVWCLFISHSLHDNPHERAWHYSGRDCHHLYFPASHAAGLHAVGWNDS